jgi:hypothetical protein
MSALGQLDGLFPNNAPASPWLPVAPGNTPTNFTINAINATFNMVSKMTTSNCNAYNSAYNDVTASADYNEVRGGYYQ